MSSLSLHELVAALKCSAGLDGKRDIQEAATGLPALVHGPWGQQPVALGDDTAAIPDGDGYLLLASEAMAPDFVQADAEFAGYCSVMVNLSDVAAMGGRPLAVVDALWAGSAADARPIWRGMQRAAAALKVPVVGGHSNLRSPFPALAVSILGRARTLLSSFAARPGDTLIAAYDLRGAMHPAFPFWNCHPGAPPERLRADLELLPGLAESGLCDAGKDISMAGLIGTSLMLLESSGVGATVFVDEIPRPAAIALEDWLLAFPSFGYLLSVRDPHVAAVLARFEDAGLAAAAVGVVHKEQTLFLARTRGARTPVAFWDIARSPLTGFSRPEREYA
ncbi:sll0787 family AIR synthase-like protein [Haliangium ochraceum]|uniref:AIR synthase related protein n=1 Tax=Haliangium ochraceum (strain DSM 14365 / JCM 11303 / SMP-2) TaxID=502025 RepID=D0LSL6_HALO1|nr:sll0787 family AIR synthase-like protein [Haliangium ochraceum]ACY17238.1 AIR synthase related protein [Haliangium ochraceum DSM 14365]